MSAPHLSLIEHDKRNISHKDYVALLDILGYEIEIKEKENNKEKDNNMNSNEDKNKENVEKNSISEILQRRVIKSKDKDYKKFADAIEHIIKGNDNENNVLIKVLLYKFTYYNDDYNANSFNSFTNNLIYLYEHDKKFLEEINTNLIKVFPILNKNIINWTKEEQDIFLKWKRSESMVFEKADSYRTEHFKMLEPYDIDGDPGFVRHYILKDGQSIYLRYWFGRIHVEYEFLDVVSLETLNSSDFLFAWDNCEKLITVDTNNNLVVEEEYVFNLFSDEDKAEILKVTKEMIEFDDLLDAQILFIVTLVEIVDDIYSRLINIELNPSHYTDEFKEFMQWFKIN